MARISIAMLSAQEQTQVEQTPAQAVQSEIEVVGQQVEDDMLELQEQLAAEDSKDQAIEDAVQATGELEEEAQAAQQILEQGGEVTQAALESIQRNVKRILKTVGMEQAAVAMESAGSSPKQALTLSMEGIKEVVQKIWEAIKKAWATAVDFVKGFLKKLFDGATKLKIRAEKIKEAASKLKGKSLGRTEDEFVAPESLKTYMRYENKAVPEAMLDRGLENMNKLMNDMLDDVVNAEAMVFYKKGLEKVNKSVLETISKGETADQQVLFEEGFKDFVEPLVKHLPQSQGTVAATKKFLSDRVITLDMKTKTIEIKDASNQKELSQKHEPLSIPVVLGVCDIVIEQMKEYDDVEKATKLFDEFIKTLKAEQSAAASNTDEAGLVKKKLQSMLISSLTGGLLSIIKRLATTVRALNFSINKSAIDWCAASVSLYNESKEALGEVKAPLQLAN